jgi:V-type H+-transporting ATPase subunit A
MAQRRHFPEVNYLVSFTKCTKVLAPYYERFDPDFESLRGRAQAILQREEDLRQLVMTNLGGKDDLDASDRVTLDLGIIIRQDFLQQNGIF